MQIINVFIVTLSIKKKTSRKVPSGKAIG